MVLVRLGVFVILCSAAVGTREAFQNSPSNRPWPPERPEGLGCIAAAHARGRAEDVLHAARIPRRARGGRAVDPGASRDRLGPGRPAVGGGDAWLHGEPDRVQRIRPNRPRRCARGSERRRPDGHAHGLRGRSRPGAFAESSRPGDPGRRTSERLADARHQRRPADGRENARHQTGTAGGKATRRTTRTAFSGRWTTGCTQPVRPTSICG